MTHPFDFGEQSGRALSPKSTPPNSIGNTILVWLKVILLGFVIFGISACCLCGGYGFFYVLPKEDLRARRLNAVHVLDTVKFDIDAEKRTLDLANRKLQADKEELKRQQAQQVERDRRSIELGIKPLDDFTIDSIKDRIKDREREIAGSKTILLELERHRQKTELTIAAIDRGSR